MNRHILIRFLVLAATIFLTGLSVSVAAQTPEELQQRYGNPQLGVYKIREAITAKVTFDKNNQAVEIVVEPLQSNDSPVAMPAATAAEILNEIMPTSQRGKFLKKGAFAASCISVQTEDYARVSIAQTTRCDSQGGGVYQLNIRRK
ncbi:MAG TPA: hypothetical protein VI306_06440 [Pyrinomonadaceae bacterium]